MTSQHSDLAEILRIAAAYPDVARFIHAQISAWTLRFAGGDSQSLSTPRNDYD